MKNLILLISLFFVTYVSNAQIKVDSSGNVGINNINPSYQLDVEGILRVNDGMGAIYIDNGSMYPISDWSTLGDSDYKWDWMYSWGITLNSAPTITSDKNLKTDIKQIGSVKNNLMKLRAVSYKLLPQVAGGNQTNEKRLEQVNKDQLGFIAQEVQEIFPEIVVQDENGYLGIKYTELIPVLVKTIQEQQAEIQSLNARLSALEVGKQ